MTSTEGSSVIHRKAQAAREEFDAREMSPAKALRLSLELCGDALFDMALTVRAVEQRALPHTELRAQVPEDHLLLLLDGPEGGRGAVLLDLQFAQALVEVQTMGRVSPGDAPPRTLTATDASVSAPLVDEMLRAFADRLEALAPGAGPGIYRYGDRLEDARAVALALTAQDFELFRLTVDIARGAKTGVLSLILPAPLLRPAEPEPGTGENGGRFDIAQVAMDATATLDAVLHRLRLPLSEICGLQPGQLIPVPASAVGSTELTATGGHVVAQVRLGQLNGARAVRLCGAPSATGELGEAPGVSGHGETGPPPVPDHGAPPVAPDGPDGADLPGGREDPAPLEAELPALGDTATGGAGPTPPNMPDMPEPAQAEEKAKQEAEAPPGGLPDLPDLPSV